MPVNVAGSGDGFIAGYPRLARHTKELLLARTETTRDGIGSQQIKVGRVAVE